MHSPLVLLLSSLPFSLSGDPASLQRAVTAAVSSGAPSVTVAPGIYNFSSGQATLEIVGASNFSLVSGGDVEFIFPPVGGLRVTHALGVSLTGPFVFDAWPPFTTQGVIKDGVRDGKWFNFTLTLDADYELDPIRFTPSRAIFFDPSTRLYLPNQVLAVTSALAAKPLGSGVWRMSVTFSANPTLSVPDGSLCALTPTPGGPVIVIENSTALVATDLTSHAAPGFTLLEIGGGGGHTYTRFNAVRRNGSTRLMVSGADVFHSTAVGAGPTLEDSELSFAADDLFAVHCELGILWRRVNSTAFYIIDTGGGKYGLSRARVGDTLDFYSLTADMGKVGASVLSEVSLVTNASLIAEAEKAAAYIHDVLHVTLRPFSVTLFLMQFRSPLLLNDYAALVELPSQCGAGTVVRNSHLHDTNGGMRLKGSRVTVENVLLERAYGMRMLPELFWTQSVSSNITLADNQLRDCGCTTLAPHAIEYNPDITGLSLVNNSVTPVNCT